MDTQLSLIHSADPVENLLAPAQPEGRVSHIADYYTRYPNETLTLMTLLESGPGWSGGVLSMLLPPELELTDYTPLPGGPVEDVMVRETPDGVAVDWCIEPLLEPGKLEFSVHTRILDPGRSAYISSQAVLRGAGGYIISQESVRVAIRAASTYLQYLPEIYHGDELVNHLLMLVESFWAPLEKQIAHPENYFDPDLAPPAFLDWLSEWIGVPNDRHIPMERKRLLLRSALSLYKRAGTRGALEEFLALYTGGKVEITEHRADNFMLGKDARLGLSVALGKNNLPHTFTVRVTVRRSDLLRQFGDQQSNLDRMYYRRLEAIIAAQKPAHTAYNLNLQIVD
jgi:phage tail-like protein